MKPSTETLIKISISCLLLICLLQLPFGYFQLIRFISVVGFAILAWYSYERKQFPVVIVYLGLAVIFQPLMVVPMEGTRWVFASILVAAGLVISIFVKGKAKT
jgi:hypothetical protein